MWMGVITPLVMGTDVGTITIDCGVRRAALNRVGVHGAAPRPWGGGVVFYSVKQSWFFASSAQSYVVYQLVGCGGCGIKLKTGCYQQEIRRNRISLKRKIPQSVVK